MPAGIQWNKGSKADGTRERERDEKMMYITDHKTVHRWHVGEKLPDLHGRIVTFQADGDELFLLLRLLQEHGGSLPKGLDIDDPRQMLSLLSHK